MRQLLHQLNAARKKAGVSTPTKKVPRQAYPKHLQSNYARQLVKLIVEEISASFQPLIKALPEILAEAKKERNDALVHGLQIVIENKRGSIRRWRDGQTLMLYDYGFINGWLGKDGDELDVYLGPSLQSEAVYIVRQMKAPAFKEYDEDKVMLGFTSETQARVAYLAQYDDPRFFGGIRIMPIQEFKAVLKQGLTFRMDDFSRASVLIDRASQSTEDVAAKAAKLAQSQARELAQYHKEQFGRQTKAGLGISLVTNDRTLPARTQHFIRENAALIKNVRADTTNRIENIISQALTTGASVDSVAKAIQERLSVAESHARLIAADQSGKWYGQVNAMRMREAGVRKFIWLTSGGPNVRDEHKARELASLDEPYSFDNPPDGELPGEPIHCECVAQPVFDGSFFEDPEDKAMQAVEELEAEEAAVPMPDFTFSRRIIGEEDVEGATEYSASPDFSFSGRIGVQTGTPLEEEVPEPEPPRLQAADPAAAAAALEEFKKSGKYKEYEELVRKRGPRSSIGKNDVAQIQGCTVKDIRRVANQLRLDARLTWSLTDPELIRLVKHLS